MADDTSNRAKMAWSAWFAPIAALLFAAAVASIYGQSRNLIERARFGGKASAAAGNQQFLSAYNKRRSGDIITIVGTAYLFDGHEQRDPHQLGWIRLKDVDKTVALAGIPVPLCDGDDIAASGTFRYSDNGGVLVVTDAPNVAATFHGPLSRLDAAIWALDSAWCGFPGSPIND